MILHTLNASPSSATFQDCLRLLAADDALLLLGDGVYAGIDTTEAAQQLLTSGASVYALEVDVQAAGLAKTLAAAITTVDYPGFVALSERFAKQQAWF